MYKNEVLMSRGKAITQRSFLKKLHDICIGGWFVILLVLIKPFIKIYLAPLHSSRIGHFVMDTETLLARVYHDQLKKNFKLHVIWVAEPLVCNVFVYNIWQKKLRVFPYSRLASAILSSAIILEKITRIKLTYRYNDWDGYLQDLHLLETSPRIFEFPLELEKECFKELESHGIDINKKWVCIAERNETYLELIQPDKKWEFNNYRNTDISSYLEAAEYLASKDIYCFRMGKTKSKILASSHTDLIVDYCNSSWRSDKLDIFLSLNCLFFLGTASGLSAIPVAARRPLLDVNLALPLHAIRSKQNHMFILKKFIDKKTLLPINLHEYLSIGEIGGFTVDNPRHLRSLDLEVFNILVMDNSSEEILEATKEMLTLLSIPNQVTPKMSAEQMEFWRAFPNINNFCQSGPIKSRIGQKFLLANNYLMERKGNVNV